MLSEVSQRGYIFQNEWPFHCLLLIIVIALSFRLGSVVFESSAHGQVNVLVLPLLLWVPPINIWMGEHPSIIKFIFHIQASVEISEGLSLFSTYLAFLHLYH